MAGGKADDGQDGEKSWLQGWAERNSRWKAGMEQVGCNEMGCQACAITRAASERHGTVGVDPEQATRTEGWSTSAKETGLELGYSVEEKAWKRP